MSNVLERSGAAFAALLGAAVSLQAHAVETRLPAGDYRIAASLNGHDLATHRVHVTDSGHAKTTFVFPSNAG